MRTSRVLIPMLGIPYFIMFIKDFRSVHVVMSAVWSVSSSEVRSFGDCGEFVALY